MKFVTVYYMAKSLFSRFLHAYHNLIFWRNSRLFPKNYVADTLCLEIDWKVGKNFNIDSCRDTSKTFYPVLTKFTYSFAKVYKSSFIKPEIKYAEIFWIFAFWPQILQRMRLFCLSKHIFWAVLCFFKNSLYLHSSFWARIALLL